MSTTLRGASAWEQELFDHLESHLGAELGLLEEYERLSAEGPESLSYVLNLILADERHHHQLFADLARTLKVEAEFLPEKTPVPGLDVWSESERVLEVTNRLLALEKADAKELKRLAKNLKDVRETTLWGLLVDIVRMDTDKHILMLEFVRERARRGLPD